jgi:hypothetical protein
MFAVYDRIFDDSLPKIPFIHHIYIYIYIYIERERERERVLANPMHEHLLNFDSLILMT